MVNIKCFGDNPAPSSLAREGSDSLSSQGSDSFVILGQGAVAPAGGGAQSDCPPRSGPASADLLTSFLSGSSSAVMDLDGNALQDKIRIVLSENLRLRDVISQNSASLRKQCDLLHSWQEENQQLIQEQQESALNCQRARSLIEQLRQENAALQAQQQGGGEGGGSPGGEDAPEALIGLRSRLASQDRQLVETRLEVERLRSKLARQQAELVACRQTAPPTVSIAAPAAELQLLREQNEQLRRQLQEEQKQRAEIEAWLNADENYGSVLGVLRGSRDHLDQAHLQLQRYTDQLGTVRSVLDGFLARTDALPADQYHWAERLGLEISGLRSEVRQLVAAAGAEAGGGFEPALAAWSRLAQLYDSLAAGWRQQDPQQRQVDMDALQARLLSTEELLAARNLECDKLQRQVLQLRRDLQAVDILKAQVDVYQQDFNAERLAREQLASEKEQLRAELRQLQTYMQQQAVADCGRLPTVDQAETPLMDHCGPPRFNIPAPQPLSSPPGPAQERQPTVYSCPKCDMAFLDIIPLQNHANRCLDEDEVA